jgi:hypothetical protein
MSFAHRHGRLAGCALVFGALAVMRFRWDVDG